MLIPWGLFAAVIGTLLATNFRGFVDRFTADARASTDWLRKVPPWRFLPEPSRTFNRGLARLIGTIFAVAGPIVLIAGIVQTIKQPPHAALPRLHPRLEVFNLAMAGAMTTIAIFNFMRGGVERNPMVRAWHRNAIGRVGTSIVAAGMLIIIVSVGLWMPPLFMAGWAVCAVGAVLTIIVDLTRPAKDPAEPEPGRQASSSGPDRGAGTGTG